jgi:hypothetical protein
MNVLQTFVLIAGLTMGAMTALFPPWQSLVSGNSYPPVEWQCVFSTAPVVSGSVYRVDWQRLQKRLIFIIVGATIIFAAVGKIKEKDGPRRP